MLINRPAGVFGTPRIHGARAGTNRVEMIHRAAIEIDGSAQRTGAGFVLPMKMAAPGEHNDSGCQKKYAEFMGKLHDPFFAKPSVLTD